MHVKFSCAISNPLKKNQPRTHTLKTNVNKLAHVSNFLPSELRGGPLTNTCNHSK